MTNANICVAIVTTCPKVIAMAEVYARSPLNPYPTSILATLQEARDWIESRSQLRKP
jgi:hypothetical protein